jgi:hypothetical protein
VGLAFQGDVLVVGSSGDDTYGPEAGSVYTYSLDEAGAASGLEPWTFHGKLSAPDAAAGARFGTAVALADQTDCERPTSHSITPAAVPNRTSCSSVHAPGRNSMHRTSAVALRTQ